MPELLTKHPDIVLKVLHDAGIQCGTGAQQQILKSCPKNQFCKLPTGELCIYGINQIPSMTQISPSELANQQASRPNDLYAYEVIVLITFLLGIGLGYFLVKKK